MHMNHRLGCQAPTGCQGSTSCSRSGFWHQQLTQLLLPVAAGVVLMQLVLQAAVLDSRPQDSRGSSSNRRNRTLPAS